MLAVLTSDRFVDKSVAQAWATLLDEGTYLCSMSTMHRILRANRGKIGGVDDLPAHQGLADGIVVTPSHNPPSDGGFKYNPPHGGPADTDATKVIAATANAYIRAALAGVKRVPFERARKTVDCYDFLGSYVADLPNVVDIARIKDAGIRIGADPLGGASVDYWGAIAERHGLGLVSLGHALDVGVLPALVVSRDNLGVETTPRALGDRVSGLSVLERSERLGVALNGFPTLVG